MATNNREPPNIGAQVHALRQKRGLSLRGLADLCDMSPTTISLIEHGETSPSVATLHRLATALSVPITSFFEEKEPRVEVILTRAGERRRVGTGSVQLESLGSGLQAQAMQLFVVTLPPGSSSGAEPITHAGHEMVYCFEGQVDYHIEDKVYVLTAGDTLLFEARLAHCWRNSADGSATFLLAFQTADQDPAQHHLHP